MTERHLILVRHAKSSWDNPDLADIDRPLNRRGERDGPVMAAVIRDQLPVPECVRVSPSLRTRMTWEFIAEAIPEAAEGMQIDDRLYHASAGELIDVVREFKPTITCAMLIVHNPGITMLANRLGNESFANVPTFGVVALRMHLDRWSDLAPDCAETLAYWFPKELL